MDKGRYQTSTISCPWIINTQNQFNLETKRLALVYDLMTSVIDSFICMMASSGFIFKVENKNGVMEWTANCEPEIQQDGGPRGRS